MSGKEIKCLQESNIDFISLTLLVFHFEISGKTLYDWHSINIDSISLTLLVSHFDMSGKDNNFSHP